ncbi:MAG: sensor histidine kinase [Bryobacteraceae bacterium]|nr:sensor histidine kinase [Bryobacteraceae bacterium]
MQVAHTESTGYRTLQTSVPLLWRQHLGILRVVLGACALFIYVWIPVSWSLFVAPALVAYTVWAAWSAFRQHSWSFDTPIVLLVMDFLLFASAAGHPTEVGLWLATVAYFYLLTQTGLLHHWHAVVGVVAATVAFFAVAHPDPASRLWPAIVLGGCLGAVLAIQRRTMEERLALALRRSVLSRSEAELAREQERQRIAADFHDGPLQSFIGFQMRLEIIRKLMSRDSDGAMRELVQLQDLGRSQVTELRAFVRGMQPAEVTPSTLSSEIREAVEHFERDSGITTELFCGDLSLLDESMILDVLQIVREVLNNARKHSKASRVRLEVEADTDMLRVRAEDDGSGFPFSGAFSLEELEVLRLGPRSIQRRVRTLGGEMTLDSRPTEGSTLTIEIPVAK